MAYSSPQARDEGVEQTAGRSTGTASAGEAHPGGKGDPVTAGWRFWLVRPGTDLLLSPYDHGPAWPAAQMTATCSAYPNHRPPTVGCVCGIYAERTKVHACERARRHLKTVRGNVVWARLCGVPIPELPSYVVGRVELDGVVPFEPEPGIIRVGVDELRAANAQIVELQILAGPDASRLGQQLATRYRVPVHANNFRRI